MHSIPVLLNWHYYRNAKLYRSVLIATSAISRQYSGICRLQDLKKRHLSILIIFSTDQYRSEKLNLWQYYHSIDQYWWKIKFKKSILINTDHKKIGKPSILTILPENITINIDAIFTQYCRMLWQSWSVLIIEKSILIFYCKISLCCRLSKSCKSKIPIVGQAYEKICLIISSFRSPIITDKLWLCRSSSSRN